ncbi:MAG: hypothetical protein LUM44_14880 [Pyrinomonadaceae bacterium]|nr:hypothetical protein [Pyrinomonadaceae bacterium]
MLKQAFKLKRDYEEAKGVALEHVVNNIESRTSKVLVGLLFMFILFEWIYGVYSSFGLEKTSETFGNAPFALTFLSSYFFFFMGSKFIFKPTEEETSDDTSMFAIFSACERREKRSRLSIILSVFHTAIYVAYLAIKDFQVK